MIKEFIFKNFFLIAKLIIYTGVGLCIYVVLIKREYNKKITNDVMNATTDIKENDITNNKNKLNKNTGILMGVGVIAIVAGIILLILGLSAIIVFVYIITHLKSLFDALE